jgi:hypothetical protein
MDCSLTNVLIDGLFQLMNCFFLHGRIDGLFPYTSSNWCTGPLHMFQLMDCFPYTCSNWCTVPLHMFQLMDCSFTHVPIDGLFPYKCINWWTVPLHMFQLRTCSLAHVLIDELLPYTCSNCSLTRYSIHRLFPYASSNWWTVTLQMFWLMDCFLTHVQIDWLFLLLYSTGETAMLSMYRGTDPELIYLFSLSLFSSCSRRQLWNGASRLSILVEVMGREILGMLIMKLKKQAPGCQAVPNTPPTTEPW